MKTYQQFITEAKKRIHMVKVHHGTSASNAEKINKSGFGGDEVHASTSSGIAKSFGQRKGEDTRIIRCEFVCFGETWRVYRTSVLRWIFSRVGWTIR